MPAKKHLIIPVINGLYYSPEEIKSWIDERRKHITLLRNKLNEFWNRHSVDFKNRYFWEAWSETFYEEEINRLLKEIKKYELALQPVGTGRAGENRKAEAKARPLAELYEGTLRKSGNKLIGHCPFHAGDDTPSFTIYTVTNTFHCFGCKFSGDTISYIMEKEKLNFREAMGFILNK